MKDRTIPIELIDLGERTRIQYGNVTELATSIKIDGLIHPPAVYHTDNMETYLLLAGGRRMAAIKQLGWTEVPVHIFDHELTQKERKCIELAENVHRLDLDWKEKAVLCRQIDTMQKEIYGEKTSTAQDAEGWSKRDTAKLMNVSPASVTTDIRLAEAMEIFPDLANCKDRKEAIKKIGAVFKAFVNQEVAKKIEDRRVSTPLEKQRSDLINSFIIKDFFTGIRDIPDKCIDIVELDPPYGIDLKSLKKLDDSISIDGYNEIDEGQYLEFMYSVLRECYRVMTDNSWIIVWFGPDPWFPIIAGIMQKVGFQFRAMPGIWTKRTGQTMRPELYLANTYEMFFYARKGTATIVKQGRSNEFSYQPVAPQNKIHPTERPIEMIQDILETFGVPEGRVLVPFLGSGNTLLAASNLGMQAFGFELTKAYKDSFTIRVDSRQAGRYKSYG